MDRTNQNLRDYGIPESVIFPSSKYWKKKKTFSSNSAIAGLDDTVTNRSGSQIILDASRSAPFGLQGISFADATITMSGANDSVTVKCSSPSLALAFPENSAGFTLEDVTDFATTPSVLNLGNGNNTVKAGDTTYPWATGIALGKGSILSGGNGKDQILGWGKYKGIEIRGAVSLGDGDDLLVGSAMGREADYDDMGIGIPEGGSIDMGAGNDTITGLLSVKNQSSRPFYSNGIVNMGDGDDQITGDAFQINGNPSMVKPATLMMGSGNDSLIATLLDSNALIDFGTGVDKLFLPAGLYTIAPSVKRLGYPDSSVQNEFFSVHSSMDDTGRSMYGADTIKGLEFLVSKNTGAEYPFAVGTIVVA